jgi:hypothetical protein
MEPDHVAQEVDETQGGQASTLAGGPRDGWGGLNVLCVHQVATGAFALGRVLLTMTPGAGMIGLMGFSYLKARTVGDE